MEEREVKLIRGASYSRSRTEDEAGFKIQKGQTMFFPKEKAKELVGTGRFVYTDQERGGKIIVCPHCKRDVDVNSAEEIVTDNNKRNDEKRRANDKHVCPFCLRDDFANSEEMKKHLDICEYNPANIAGKKEKKEKKEKKKKSVEKGITSEDLNKKD